ncbi:MAG: hypothetical protein NTY19_36815 [Planctomycetota bacterium]|nr:hypothetical protein [Planctomycetota bacterium]
MPRQQRIAGQTATREACSRCRLAVDCRERGHAADPVSTPLLSLTVVGVVGVLAHYARRRHGAVTTTGSLALIVVPATEAAAAAPALPKDAISVALLQKAKKLASQFGSIKEAKQAIDALAQLMD